MKKEVMTMANAWAKMLGREVATRLAWSNVKLRTKLQKEERVEFSYQKKDGSIRQAVGTLVQGIIPEVEGKRIPSQSVQTYWDLEANAWRCFSKLNLIS